MPEAEEKKKKLNTQKIGMVIAGTIVIIAVVTAYYFFTQYQKAQLLLQNPTLAAQMQEKALLSQVGKLMVLPSDEDPQVATVSDVTKLQDQPFFAHAANGDKVLIYTKARVAILYDPVANKIINVAPVNFGNNNPVIATPTPTSTLHRKIVVTPRP